jgi:hypothetical protein
VIDANAVHRRQVGEVRSLMLEFNTRWLAGRATAVGSVPYCCPKMGRRQLSEVHVLPAAIAGIRNASASAAALG